MARIQELEEARRRGTRRALARALGVAAAISVLGLGYRYTALTLSPDGRFALVEYCSQEIEGFEDARTGMTSGGGCLEKALVPTPVSVWVQQQLGYTFAGFVAFSIVGFGIFKESR